MSIDRYEISLSTGKTFAMMAIALLFVAGGLWMASLDPAEILTKRKFNNPTFVHGVGWAAAIMGALVGLLVLRKLFDKKPGLVLDEEGIFDNSSAASAGFIPWKDIAGFDVLTIQKQRMMVVRLVDPEKYIARGGTLRQMFNRINSKMSGSPISITSSTLRIGFDDMLALCNNYLQKYGSRAAQPALAADGARPTDSARR